jgi:hypothetical protein
VFDVDVVPPKQAMGTQGRDRLGSGWRTLRSGYGCPAVTSSLLTCCLTRRALHEDERGKSSTGPEDCDELR